MRLVYADWLEEHGHDDQALLIRIQCESQKILATDPGEAAKLAAQAEAIVIANAREWAHGLYAAGADDVEYDRGILEGVRIRDDRLDGLEELLAVCPPTVHKLKVRYLVRGYSPAAEVLAGCPSSQRLDVLDLADCFLSVEGLRAMTASDHLKGLAELRLDRCWIGNEGAELLAQAMNLPLLRRLDLTSNNVTPEGVRALVESPLAERLTHLDLSANWIGDEGAAAISDSSRLQNLNRLVLQDPRVGGRPWGVSREGMLQIARANLPPDMILVFGHYRGTFAMLQENPNWFLRSTGHDVTR